MQASARPASQTGTPLQGGERSGKYLTFKLGQEEFGVAVAKLREIMGMQQITAVPQTPDYVKGVMNLRGKVIPVIELRLKFGMPRVEYTPRTSILVMKVESDAGAIHVGAIVDAVCEVVNLACADIEDAAGVETGPAAPHIIGIAKLKGKKKTLLDLDGVVSAADIMGFGAFVERA